MPLLRPSVSLYSACFEIVQMLLPKSHPSLSPAFVVCDHSSFGHTAYGYLGFGFTLMLWILLSRVLCVLLNR